jgi:hypothetical protein
MDIDEITSGMCEIYRLGSFVQASLSIKCQNNIIFFSQTTQLQPMLKKTIILSIFILIANLLSAQIADNQEVVKMTTCNQNDMILTSTVAEIAVIKTDAIKVDSPTATSIVQGMMESAMGILIGEKSGSLIFIPQTKK